MTDRTITIKYEEYGSLSEMVPEDRELCEAAIQAQKTSYAPYSKFNVGAAVRLSGGTIVTGSNQENAASPSGLCAERTAMFAATANYPDQSVRSIAIVGGPEYTIEDSPCSPCGSCRQVMAECQKRAGTPMSVIMVGGKKIWKFSSVDDVLPFIFTSLY